MSPSTPPRPRRWWALAAVVACLLLIGLDTTTVFLALPELMTGLPASAGQLQGVFVAYLLTFGLLMMPLGAAADRLGRRRVLLAGLLLFGLGAAGAALAADASALLLARAGMGLGAAVIMPTAMAMLPVLFPPAERARAFAVASAAVSLGLCLGPLVAGALLQHYWWGSVFLVDVPIVLVAAVLVLALFPESRAPRPAARADRRPSRPVLVLALVYVLMTGFLFVLTPYLDGVGSARGLAAGVRLLPLVGALLVGAALGERLGARVGPRIPAVAGALLLAAGLGVFATVGSATAAARVTAGLVAVGAGLGAMLTSALRAATADSPDDLLGVVRWTTAVRQVAGAVGVVLAGTTLSLVYRDHPSAIGAHLGAALNRAAEAGSAGGGLRAAARLAYLDGLHAAVLVGAGLALVAAGIAATGRFGPPADRSARTARRPAPAVADRSA
ncbi:MFS transporter [Micromonospora eburnea]|uniref:Predicted arabinose efflux permease, MFS family n=1 Tax=Micromonospora eburnea TaxID=227316 RepID=A0A1C6UH57_9ACTN|nr:MFS transporter [Micromonospora eburnea]SCL53284.1 Predicted arabinose efflux permease, MFS family [Micromonospora eburnea]